MTLLEYAEKTSPIPLTAWQRELLTMYEQAVKDGKELIYMGERNGGRIIVKSLINQYYGRRDDLYSNIESVVNRQLTDIEKYLISIDYEVANYMNTGNINTLKELGIDLESD